MSVRYPSSIENASCFSFVELSLKVKKDLRIKYPHLSDKDFMEVMMRELKTFTLNDQTFDYFALPNKLGGYRWYVICPKCRKPSIKLYLPSPEQNRELKYLCKDCHRLKNISLILGASDSYKKVIRPLKHLEKLKKEILKRNTTPERAQPLIEEYERKERELLNSADYKLWKFKEEHRSPVAG